MKKMKEAPGGGEEDPLDILDQINEELGFLGEVVTLLDKAHSKPEPEHVTISHIASNMLDRLGRLKELAGRLFEHTKRTPEAL